MCHLTFPFFARSMAKNGRTTSTLLNVTSRCRVRKIWLVKRKMVKCRKVFCLCRWKIFLSLKLMFVQQNWLRMVFIFCFFVFFIIHVCIIYELIFIVELLGVLNWCDHVANGTLSQSLTSLQSVPGGEIVKFLQDILDALFSILTQVIFISIYESFHPQFFFN